MPPHLRTLPERFRCPDHHDVAVRINEIESDNGTPVEWVEPFNLGAVAVDLSGFTLPDNDNTRGYAVPAGTRNGAPAQAAETVQAAPITCPPHRKTLETEPRRAHLE